MRIKEMEERSGMTRANIRFYESEGFLSPKREENGYREYSEEDLEVLMRIKLLRSLHISLEEIKEIHNGRIELMKALDLQLEKLNLEKEDIEHSQKICQTMRNDGVRYQTLNAQRYLNTIEPIVKKSVPEYEKDIIPKVRSPWRRYFARSIDFSIYSLLWSMFLGLGFHVNLSNSIYAGGLIRTIVSVFLMLLIEPLLISLFGTTLGKWILGLRITNDEGERLTYSEARTRTIGALWYGVGFYIPIYSLVRLWKSFRDCNDGDTLSWEYDSAMTLKDKKPWRTGAVIGTYILQYVILFMIIALAAMPKHRGDITIAEFCENYNQLSDYYGMGTNYYLDKNGKWVLKESYPVAIIEIGGAERPEYIFTEKDGVMTGMQFSVKFDNGDIWFSGYKDEMYLLMLSFIQAQNGYNPFGNGAGEISRKVQEAEYEDFSYTRNGIMVTCDIDYSGYIKMTDIDMFLPTGEEDNKFIFTFSMVKE